MVAPPDNEVLWGHSLHHAHQGSPALLGVTLGARAGEILGITGPRGAGRTTLLRCLSGQLAPDAGEVWFEGVPMHAMPASARDRLRRERFGWIGPGPRLVPELTARENAALPLLLAGAGHRDASRTAHEWLERLDIGDLAGALPAALTQAQRQRVAIARALAARPDVLFADEPAAPLHSADRAQVLRTLTTAARSHGISVLLAVGTTDATFHADRVVTLVDGRLTQPDGPEPGGVRELVGGGAAGAGRERPESGGAAGGTSEGRAVVVGGTSEGRAVVVGGTSEGRAVGGAPDDAAGRCGAVDGRAGADPDGGALAEDVTC